MGGTAKTFLSEFHNLPGETVKEKHRNLFQLFRRYSSLEESPHDLDFVATSLKAVNHLEKIFRVDFLNHFQRFNELYEEFRNGDDITFAKVSKQDWFFQTAFKERNAEEFVSEVLPSLSYSLKLKILKKLSATEEYADEVFDLLCKQYGVFLATALLPKCSSSKIRDTLKLYPVKFTVSQLKIVYDKDPELIVLYLEEATKLLGSTKFINNSPILVYIAQKNPDLFSILFDKYKFEVKLGHRTTKRYIKSQKTEVLSKPESYLAILNQSVTVRKLGSGMKHILFKKFKPENPFWESILGYYPKKHQFSIFKTAYDAIHHKKFGENIDAISDEMLKLIPDPEFREQIAKLKLEKHCDNSYLKYVTPDYCIKEFMDKIDHLTASERATYIKLATECCILNEDMTNLLKICELVAVRFKNDATNIRDVFWNEIGGESKIMDKFTEKHWKFVIEIHANLKAKSNWIRHERLVMFEYIKFLVLNDKSLEETIPKYSWWLEAVEYNGLKNPDVFKPVANYLMEHGLEKLDRANENDAEKFDCRLLVVCHRFNKHNPKNPIQIKVNSRILKSAKVLFEKEKDNSYYICPVTRSGMEYIVCQKHPELAELKQMYFKALKNFGQISGLVWFLRNEPKTFQENFDYFLDVVKDWYENPTRFFKLLRNYSYLGLDRRAVDFIKSKLKDRESGDKTKLVKNLAILSTADSYLEYLKDFIPKSEKVDLTDDRIKDLYSVQGKLVQSLPIINSPSKVLPVALQFCKGDYLQFALTPLYSCFYKIPENQTKPFLEKLEDIKAISVKKHAMHLTCVLYDVDTVYRCLKNATVPSQLAALKYFVKNPSDTFWTVVEEKIKILQKTDLHLLKYAMNIVIPTKYKNKWVETVWTILDKYDNKELKKILVTSIDKECIRNLHPELAYKIIQGMIFKLEEANAFIANLLIYLNDPNKIVFLSKLLTEFKENCFNRKETQREARRKLSKFVVTLCEKYFEAEESDHIFVSNLLRTFTSTFSLPEIFEEYVLISCMALKGENTEKQAKILSEINHNLEAQFGAFAVHGFANTFNCCISKRLFDEEENEIFRLCDFLLKMKKSVNDCLLVLQLLPRKETESAEYFVFYEGIVQEISQMKDNLIQLQYNLFLRQESSTERASCNTIQCWNMRC